MLRTLLAAVLLATLTPTRAENLTVTTVRGEATVMKNPERFAVYDWAALDSLHQLGVKVPATTKPVRVDYLQPVFAAAQPVGELFKPDMEALVAYRPQLVITGGPGAEAYENLAQVAPTIDLTVDNGRIRTSGEAQIRTLGQIFNREEQAETLVAAIDKTFAEAREAARGQGRGLVLSITGNKVSAFGPKARLASWIHEDLGLEPVDRGLENAPHGQPVSFEYIHEKNPDWLFVLDRTAALGDPGAPALTVLDNELVRQTTAWQKGQVVLMPTANYVVAGGAQQLQQAAAQLRDAFRAHPVAKP